MMKKELLVCSLSGLLTIAVVIGGLWLITDRSNSAAGANRVVIVKNSADSLPVPDSALDARGALIFTSWSDARANVDETTKAIILTNSTLSGADTKWLRDIAHGGMVIGGFDVSSSSIASALGLYEGVPVPEGAEIPTPPTLDGTRFGDDPFFSLILDLRTENHARRGGMVERFLSTDQFLAHVERFVSNATAAK